jgi:hypothetical protein
MSNFCAGIESSFQTSAYLRCSSKYAMLFHFKDKFLQLEPFWDKYSAFQERLEIPAKTVLLEEGQVSKQYIFIEKGCVRAYFNNNGSDKTV